MHVAIADDDPIVVVIIHDSREAGTADVAWTANTGTGCGDPI